MNATHTISFRSLIALVFLIPLFFIPSALLPLGVAKGILLSIGLIVAVIALLLSALRAGGLRLPSTWLLWSAAALPLVYLLSAIVSQTPKLALFGYNLEIGTFGFTLLMSVLIFVTAAVVISTERLLRVYGALSLSFIILIALAFIKILSGGHWLNLSVLQSAVGNPVGSWTDYAVGFGLAASFLLLALAMLPLSRRLRITLGTALTLSVALLAVLNFSVAWQLMLLASLLSLIYLATVERSVVREEGGIWRRSKLWPAAAVLVVSLFFVINPTIGSTTVGNHISNAFHLSNSDVRPSLSSTLTVAKSVLAKHALLGSGPNTFDQDWFLYKPALINGTSFWSIAFPFGVGFVPTALATTGLLGALGWLVLILLTIILGARALTRRVGRPERFAAVTSFIGALVLWVATAVYVPSATILALAAVFTGLLIAASAVAGVIPVRQWDFHKNQAWNFGSVLVAAVVAIGALTLVFFVGQKSLSIIHFERALALSRTDNTPADAVESELNKAISLSPTDLYYGALSELAFARAQGLLQSTSTPEASQAAFQTAVQESITAAHTATQLNPGNYQNWIRLGNIYESLVPAPLAVTGAYDNAKAAFDQAGALNPESPEPSLMEARLEIDNKNADAARADIMAALKKKQDYADAYFLLTELDVAQNNAGEAIQSATAASILSPDNAGIFFELGLLKYSTGDYRGAADALAQAIKIVPNYANATYFLGLAEGKLGNRDGAIAAFQNLAKTNPDNADIQAILGNLEAGKDPFYQAPAKDSKPLKNATPPITNQE